MADITLSSAVRNNLLSLQKTADLLGKTQERLATGLKVNSALDDPTAFFTASSLSSRANDLNRLQDSLSNGIQTIQAADDGLTAITNTVETLQATVRQARQDASFKSASYTVDTDAIGTSTAKNISFSGGSVGSTPVNVALNTADTTPATQGSYTAQNVFAAPSLATAGSNSFTFAGGGSTFAATDQVTFDIDVDGAGASTITINQAAVQAEGNGDAVVDDIDEFTDILQTLIGGGVTVTNDGADITITSATTGAASSVVISNIDGDPDAGDLNQTFGITNGAGTAGADPESFALTIDGVNVTLNNGNAGTLSDAVDTINAALTAGGVTDVTAQDDGTGKLQLVGAADGSNDPTVGGAGEASVFGTEVVVAADLGSQDGSVKTVDELVAAINADNNLSDKVRATNDNGKLRIENLSLESLTVTGANATVADGDAGKTNSIGGNEVRQALVNQFNTLRTQLDQLADDSSFNGINLLRGDKLKLNFNESGTSNIEIQATDSAGNVRAINTTNLGITASTNAEFGSNSSLDTRLEGLSDALTTLRTQASQFGSNLSIVQNRQDFTKSIINTLETGAANLTLADTNEEGANLLALQTRQQLSSTALSMASQADQNVLRLF